MTCHAPLQWMLFDTARRRITAARTAQVADEESLALTDKIVNDLPSHTPGGPNTMRFLKTRLDIEVVKVDESEAARYTARKG